MFNVGAIRHYNSESPGWISWKTGRSWSPSKPCSEMEWGILSIGLNLSSFSTFYFFSFSTFYFSSFSTFYFLCFSLSFPPSSFTRCSFSPPFSPYQDASSLLKTCKSLLGCEAWLVTTSPSHPFSIKLWLWSMQGFPWTKPLSLTSIRQNLKEPILDFFAIVDIVQTESCAHVKCTVIIFFHKWQMLCCALFVRMCTFWKLKNFFENSWSWTMFALDAGLLLQASCSLFSSDFFIFLNSVCSGVAPPSPLKIQIFQPLFTPIHSLLWRRGCSSQPGSLAPTLQHTVPPTRGWAHFSRLPTELDTHVFSAKHPQQGQIEETTWCFHYTF